MPNRSIAAALLCLLVILGVASAKGPFNLEVLRRDGYGATNLFLLQENRLTARATINGEKVRLVLDTGFDGPLGLDGRLAGVNLATEKAEQSGYAVSGKVVKAHKGMAQSVVMGNVQLTSVPVEVGAFKGFDEERAQKFMSTYDFDQDVSSHASAAGFIGRDFLRTNHAVIDLGNRMLYLRPPGKGRAVQLAGALAAAGMGQAAITNGNLVDVEINGVPGKMVIDTGAVASLIDPRFAAKAKAKDYGSREMEMRDISGEKSRTNLTGLSGLRIAGIPARAPTVTQVNFSYYTASGGKIVGLLGLDFLGQNWCIIDFGQNKLYFAKAK